MAFIDIRIDFDKETVETIDCFGDVAGQRQIAERVLLRALFQKQLKKTEDVGMKILVAVGPLVGRRYQVYQVVGDNVKIKVGGGFRWLNGGEYKWVQKPEM